VLAEFEVDLVFPLAALLSTRSEFTPVTAHEVNVEGTLRLLEFAQHEGESHGRPVIFMYPSSIAAYGLPDLAMKTRIGRVPRGRVEHPGDDVRLQQAVLRTSGAVLCQVLQAVSP
jgi:nucleoside-diphosphate-sugar epimerase